MKIVGGVVAAIAVIGLFSLPAIKHNTTQELVRNVTVTGKERITETDGEGRASSKYLIFTDRETFENTDSFWGWKFNSSDVYGKIEKGYVCDFRVVGWRVQFLSAYRNILQASCKKPDEKVPNVPTGQ